MPDGAAFSILRSDLYTAYGLSIACDFALPELAACEGLAPAAAPDVEVRLGRALEAGSFEAGEEDLRADLNVGRMAWPGVGRFSLRLGRQVLVEPQAGAAEQALRLFLLGPVLATVLFQRGFLVLHASAVALPDADGRWGAVAFVGDSGEGKSTMAAQMHARGFPIVADDIIAVPPAHNATASNTPGAAPGTPAAARPPLIAPGFARLSLWPRSVAAVGLAWGLEAPEPDSGRHKLYCRADAGFSTRALPLRCLYVLGGSDDVRILPLSPALRVVELARHSYRAVLLQPSERAAQFERCGALAGVVPVRQLRRPRDLARLQDVARAIERDCQGEM